MCARVYDEAEGIRKAAPALKFARGEPFKEDHWSQVRECAQAPSLGAGCEGEPSSPVWATARVCRESTMPCGRTATLRAGGASPRRTRPVSRPRHRRLTVFCLPPSLPAPCVCVRVRVCCVQVFKKLGMPKGLKLETLTVGHFLDCVPALVANTQVCALWGRGAPSRDPINQSPRRDAV